MNIAFILIWLIIIVALIFLGLEVRRNVVTIDGTKNTYIFDLNNFSCYPGNNIENLPQVIDKCCVINGQKSNKRPFQDLRYEIDTIVDTNPIPGSEACFGFCKNVDVTTGQCLDLQDTSPENISSPYRSCITATSITPGCTAMSLPVARDDQVPYFIVGRRAQNCSTLVDC
jgi:hypothetical protein